MFYNPKDAKSIEEYSKSLIGQTFSDVIEAYNYRHSVVKENASVYGETIEMPLNKRRFMMGNALVVNIIAKLEKNLNKIFDAE